MMGIKSILGILFVPTFILLVPWVAMRFSDEVNWDFADFAIMWVLMAGVGFAYKLATSRTGHVAFRVAVGLALATAFILVWMNLAVGLIGSEDHPANLMYFGVLVIGGVGAGIVRFEPRGMVYVLLATAVAQALVPMIALMIWQPEFSLGVVKVLVLNAVFVVLFAASAWLFRCAAGASFAAKQANLGR